MQILTGEPRLCAGVDQLADPGRGRGQTRRQGRLTIIRA
jgi:hypothetical protein